MKKVFSTFLVLATTGLLVVSINTMSALATAGSYSIPSGASSSLSGTVLSVSGTSIANPQTGSNGTQHMAVAWDYDAALSCSSQVWSEANYNNGANDFFTFTPTFNANGFTATWSGKHPYTTSGSHAVKIVVYHGSPCGNDGSDAATLTLNVVIPPTLKVIKHVINDNGGVATASSFTMQVTATNVSPSAIFPGNEAGTTVTMTPGAYSVSETGPTGYTATYSADCSGTTLSGDNKVCTVTNNDNPTSTPPVLSGVPATATIPELANYTFTASATDSDIPAQILTFSLVGAPSGASINASTGAFSWTPTEAQGPGSYPFTVRVSDGTNNTDAAITITVTEVNSVPSADAKNASVNEDASVSVTLSGSDSDIPTQTLTFAKASDPAHGSVSVIGNVATYTPNADYNGSDSFTYTVSDGVATSAPKTVTITVLPVNDAPVLSGVPTEATTPELSSYTFTASGSDVDGDTLTFSLVGAPSGASINASTGAFSWTPTEAQGPGVYTFSVQLSDGHVNVVAPIAITVTEVNSAPSATGTSITTAMNTDKDVVLSGTDSDIPANTLSYEISNDPMHGSLSLSGNTATYTPANDFVGNDSFDFEVCDEGTLCATATVTVTVSNDAPSLDEIGNQTVDEETTLSFTATATDPNGDTITYGLENAPSGATIDPSTGAFSWTPTEAQGPGSYTMTITATDGAATDSQTFTITVGEVNKAPVGAEQSVTLDEDTTALVTLTGSDDDVPVQSLTFVLVDAPAHGTAALVGSMVTYTPNANYNGGDAFTYSVDDGVTNSVPATITLTVNPVNDAPTIVLNGSESISITAGSIFTDESATCSDIDGEELTPTITGTVQTSTVGSYTLTYTCTDSAQASASVTRTVAVQPAPAQCSNGIDDDGDGHIDYPADPGCSSADDNNEVDPPRTTGGGWMPKPKGEVLGAETTCGIYLDKYLRMGYKNNPTAVTKVQQFLNDYTQAGLALDGKFGKFTDKAVKAFQLKHRDTILDPWHIASPTGIVYLTTTTQINKIMCPTLNLGIPTNLVPFSSNPETPKKS